MPSNRPDDGSAARFTTTSWTVVAQAQDGARRPPARHLPICVRPTGIPCTHSSAGAAIPRMRPKT